MSATMGRQGGRVQLEQSVICLASNMAKIAKGGILRIAIKKMQHQFRKPRATVRDENEQGVKLAGHKKMKAAIERQPAMLCQDRTA